MEDLILLRDLERELGSVYLIGGLGHLNVGLFGGFAPVVRSTFEGSGFGRERCTPLGCGSSRLAGGGGIRAGLGHLVAALRGGCGWCAAEARGAKEEVRYQHRSSGQRFYH